MFKKHIKKQIGKGKASVEQKEYFNKSLMYTTSVAALGYVASLVIY